MPDDLEIPFDRITYRDGQLLTALDLGDEHRREARLRRLHSRYLHETWGIALGFEVQKEGTGAVVVGPGYAVDGMGRDLLLAEGMHLPVPNVPGQQTPETFVLTMSYQEDAALHHCPALAHLCLGNGLDPCIERPRFSWHKQDEVRFGPHVPLVQVAVLQGVIQGGLDFRVRRNARPLVRPHIGWGATEPGRTGWRGWQVQVRMPLGIETVVSTAEAGFTSTPHYFALLHGSIALDTPMDESLSLLLHINAQPSQQESVRFLDNLSFITDTAQDKFTYRLIGLSPQMAEQRQMYISWFGVEPVTGCEPIVDLTRLFDLAGYSILTRLALQARTSEA
jgi:hypothetical protein